MSRAILINANAEQSCQGGRIRVGQRQVGAFDPARGSGSNPGGRDQLRLCQSFDDAPVARVALLGINGHDLADRSLEDLHDPCQQINLRSRPASFPCMPRSRCRRRQDEKAKVEAAVDDAIEKGKITPGRRKHWVELLSCDPGIADVLASIPNETAVALSEIGHASAESDTQNLTPDQNPTCFY
jgi:hypothetical protein